MPAPNPDKLLVTNLARLEAKYGPAKMPALKAAVKKLIAADAGRGLKTALVDLSSTTEMNKFHGTAVPADKADDPRANKQAIDKVFAATQPSYLMLLGSIDVIAHQDLKNPLFDPADDNDELAWSDLPYACEAPYSTDIRKFLAPTRVVGRLPDLTAGTDVGYLVGLLETAASYQQLGVESYSDFLGLSADVWKKSTSLSLTAVFGSAAAMKVSPPDGPNWTATALKPRSHFINCHGAPADFRFYGQKGNSFPVAHSATVVNGHVTPGTIVAAECCYGAELYDPAKADGHMGLCNTYLGDKAVAYFGSSTIAYGPADGNDQADLLCQYFLKHVRAGASVGRACLQARLDYITQASALKPVDLKTLAQFSVMADPALTPVKPTVSPGQVVSLSKSAKAMSLAATRVATTDRLLRRQTLRELSSAAVAASFVAGKVLAVKPSTKAVKNLLTLAANAGFTSPRIISFALTKPHGARMKALAKGAGFVAPRAVHTVVQRLPAPADHGALVRIRGLEVVEYDGTLQTREFYSR